MNAAQLRDEKLARYESAFCAGYMSRVNLPELPEGEAFDLPAFAQRLDPALVKADFENGLRAIATDFVDAFNEMLRKAEAQEPLVARFADAYRMRVDHQGGLESSLRQMAIPVYQGLNDLGQARAAYLAFASNAGMRAAGLGLLGGKIGAVVGTLVCPGVGTVAGAALGGWLGGSTVDEQGQELAQDFGKRVDAVTAALTGTWASMQQMLKERFHLHFGTGFQRLAKEVQRLKAQQAQMALMSREQRFQFRDEDAPPAAYLNLAPARLGSPTPWAIAAVLLISSALGGGSAWWLSRGEGTTAEQRDTPDTKGTQIMVSHAAILRAGPADGFHIVARLNGGQRAQLLDESVPGWFKVKMEGVGEGWFNTNTDTLGLSVATTVTPPSTVTVAAKENTEKKRGRRHQ